MSQLNIGQLTIEELAGLVSSKLKDHGLEAILVGGACATIYSENKYRSFDLDYVIYDGVIEVERALGELGFKRKGRLFIHDQTPFLIDMVSPPVAIGETFVNAFATLRTQFGDLVLLTPTDCAKDRLASFYHWGDMQGLEQAILVCQEQDVDLEEIERWSNGERCADKYQQFVAWLNG